MNSGNCIALKQIAGYFLKHIPAPSVTPLTTKVWAEVRWSVSRAEQDTLKPERQVSSSYWFSGWRGQVWKLEESMKHDWGKDRMSWNQMPKMQGYQCVQGHIPGEAETNTTQARPDTWNRDRLFVWPCSLCLKTAASLLWDHIVSTYLLIGSDSVGGFLFTW